jgi:ATP-binding cassette, subfamily B, bacterial
MVKAFPHFRQHDVMDCGPTCLRIIAKHHGKDFSINKLRDWCNTSKIGSSLIGLVKAAEKMNMRSMPLAVDYEQLAQEVPLPCIAHWQGKHFVVVYKIKDGYVYVSDPAHKKMRYSQAEFSAGFSGIAHDRNANGFIVMLDPTANFYAENAAETEQKRGFRFLLKYLIQYKKYIFQLVIGLFAVGILNLIFPFLTQSIMDVGIKNQDIGFIYLVLFAQLMLFAGRTTIDLIRSWILMHISKRINISLLADYFMKLMRLPIAQFDSKMIGDFLQRIGDHEKIERLMTSTSLNTIFSLFTFLIFGSVLGYYSLSILSIFAVFSLLYIGWSILFLKRRRDLDYRTFSQMSENQSKTYELLIGMREIKLNNAERKKRWEWEAIQAKLFKTSLSGLSIQQWQQGGSLFINELKNIFITFYSAKLVLTGELSLGMMLAISYIIGQLNAPIAQFIELIMAGQSAKISLERLAEIHDKEDEDTGEAKVSPPSVIEDITINNLSFRYDKNMDDCILKDLNLVIPAQKTTAIVGTSGSGKTTLLKLLLKFYNTEKGDIFIGNTKFKDISSSAWREKCGVVMQEGMSLSVAI